MAIRKMVFECDSEVCWEHEEFRTEDEATETGWFIVRGPERILGTDERVYCSQECLEMSL